MKEISTVMCKAPLKYTSEYDSRKAMKIKVTCKDIDGINVSEYIESFDDDLAPEKSLQDTRSGKKN